MLRAFPESPESPNRPIGLFGVLGVVPNEGSIAQASMSGEIDQVAIQPAPKDLSSDVVSSPV